MTRDSTDLNVEGVLGFCINAVPANQRVSVAIAAHRIAVKAFQHDPEARRLAEYVLHAIVLARTPAIEDCRQQLDYLAGLPESAWPDSAEHSARDFREATLDMIRRQIAWVSICV